MPLNTNHDSTTKHFHFRYLHKKKKVFENRRKSLIRHCERSELRIHFEWTKVNPKCQKVSIWANFCKPEACGQTVLPDRSILIGQKLVENAKIQTMWKLVVHNTFTIENLVKNQSSER